MALMDFIKGPEHKATADRLNIALQVLQQQHTALQQIANDCGALDLQTVRERIRQEQKVLEGLREQIRETRHELSAEQEAMSAVRQQIVVLEDTVLLESFALYVPKFQFTNSAAYKERLDRIRLSQKELIKNGKAATGNLDWEVNGKKSEGKKLVSDMIKLLIRSFNNECDYCVDNVKFDNVEIGESRIRKSFAACNKLGRVMTVALTDAFLSLKVEELYLAYEFQVKKHEEKEAAKKAREELREQQKLEQEIRAARDKILKERKHFNAALKNLMSRLAASTEPQERADLQARIVEVQATRDELDQEEKLIDYREQNAKAGYVYVISNVGAFGEGVYKIGMTRRLEPMDRVDELGDASVPFWFDVHAMVFSENAPALEAKLHERFAAGRLNKVNGRKEFFRADIREIEDVIRANYDSVVEVVRDAPAEQYRESLRMTMPAPAIQAAERIAIRETA
jgi:hypothetical protein